MSPPSDLATATAKIGAAMVTCDSCPCCGGADMEQIPCRNDLHDIDGIDGSMKESDYHACLDCGLIFARRRQSADSVALFYAWFAHLEQRDYAVYPPPQPYVQAKADAAKAHVQYLVDHDILAPAMNIAHVRCDVGSLLRRIRDRYPDCSLHGYDYFDTNLRYARDTGFDHAQLLDPAQITLPADAAYDLIICNHTFTHAFNPIADLRALYRALKPGGLLYLHGEADHLLRFQPGSPFYQWVALNNFHKQLLSAPSLKNFLTTGGFSVITLEHSKYYMQVLARRQMEAGDGSDEVASKLAARSSATVMAGNFRRWAKRRESLFLPVLKVTAKVRTSLRRRA